MIYVYKHLKFIRNTRWFSYDRNDISIFGVMTSDRKLSEC